MANMSANSRFIRGRELKTENGKLRTENGEWRAENRKQRTENGKGFSVLRSLFSAFCFLFSVFFLSPLHSQPRTLLDLRHAYKNTKFQFFPIPYLETDPSAGERYGLMPTFLWYEGEELITIGLAALTYNKVVGVNGFVGLYVYPSKLERLELYLGAAQHFEQDFFLRYVNETGLEEKLDVDIELEYAQDPFERFFGFGPETQKENETNFVSHVGHWKGRLAYEVVPHIDVQLEEKWNHASIFQRALDSVRDTATLFGGNPEVANSNQWTHRFSLIWDTRDSKQFSRKGHQLETYGLLSHPLVDIETPTSGFGFFAKKYFTLGGRFTTVGRFTMDRLLGDTIPFYEQKYLGGKHDLRGFKKRRFTGKGKILFEVEERILVKSWHIMKATFDFSIDPFISVGQVFNRWGEIERGHLQPTGGIGFRALVPPSVVGRVDVGISGEEVGVYTTLDYPF